MRILGAIPGLFALVVGGITLVQAINGLRSGRLTGRGYDFSRAQTPIGFWFMMGVLCAMGGGAGIVGAGILCGVMIGDNH